MRNIVGSLCIAGLLITGTAQAATAPRIDVLSNRADLISGGDALVRVTPPASEVTVAGRDVTSAFAITDAGTYEGLITGLANGENLVTAKLADGSSAQITIDNHPQGGPVVA